MLLFHLLSTPPTVTFSGAVLLGIALIYLHKSISGLMKPDELTHISLSWILPFIT